MENPRFNLNNISKYRDEIMGFAIIWIMLFHSSFGDAVYFSGMRIIWRLGRFIELGNTGCDVFMFVSGIGLFYSFSKSIESNTLDLKAFYIKRLKRLFIPVWIIWGPYWTYLITQSKLTPFQFFLNMTELRFWIDGTTNTWFISAMILCYILFPAIYKIIHGSEKHRFIKTAAMMAAIVAFLLIFEAKDPDNYYRYEIALTRIPAFIFGGYAGYYVKKETRISVYWFIPALAFFFGGFELLFRRMIPGGSTDRLYQSVEGLDTALILSAFFSWKPIALMRKPFAFMGKISLECYLAHLVLAHLYQKNLFFYSFVSGSQIRFIGVLVIATILAYIVSLIDKKLFNL